MFLKSFFHIVVEKSFNIVKNKRAMAGKKANKKQVHPHLSGVQKAVVSFANMFEKNRRINREAQRVIKRKTPQKVRTLLYGKRGRRIEERSSVLSVEVLMGRGGDINWRRIPICICVLGVKKSFGHS